MIFKFIKWFFQEEKEFYLDWSKQKLLGWEEIQLQPETSSAIEGIIEKDYFPPVPVVQDPQNPDVFCISRKYLTFKSEGIISIDGGHHRALAHYLLQKPLKCKLVDYKASASSEYTWFFGLISYNPIEIKDIFTKKTKKSIKTVRMPDLPRLEVILKSQDEIQEGYGYKAA